MELRSLGPCGLLDGPVAGLDAVLGQAIEPGELGHGIGGECSLVPVILPAPEDHAELRSPIAQVIVTDHMMAQGGEDPGQAVADHGRADVPDVHGLGDVRRREVDHHRSRTVGSRDPGEAAAEQIGQAAGDPGVVQPDVEETWPGDLGWAGQRLEIHGSGNLSCQNAGIELQRLAQGHAAVGLVVTEFRVVRGADGRLEDVGIAAFRSRGSKGGS